LFLFLSLQFLKIEDLKIKNVSSAIKQEIDLLQILLAKILNIQ
jgi:hypothetical protein